MASGVPDRMRYSVKVSAADSTNKMTTIHADRTDTYDGSTSSTITFIIPHSSFSEFVDPVMSRIRFRLQVTIPKELQNVLIKFDDHMGEILQLDKGIESII